MVIRDDDEEKKGLLSLPSGLIDAKQPSSAGGAGGTSEADKRAAGGLAAAEGLAAAGGMGAASGAGGGSVGGDDAEAKRYLLADRSLADTAIAVPIAVVLFALVAALVLFGVLSPPSPSISGTIRPVATAVPTATTATTAAIPTTVATTAPTTVATTAPTVVVPPAEGPLTVPFTTMDGVTTTKSYTGTTTIIISGVGQTAGKSFSDAFYTYTDLNGQPPLHDKKQHSLCINNKPVDNFVQSIPAYSPDHTYTFKIQAPGGPLSFGVCDNVLSDNTGSFTIRVL